MRRSMDMNGTRAAKARRNLTMTQDRQVWLQAHGENHPMRYRLYCQEPAMTRLVLTKPGNQSESHRHDYTYNLRCDRITLLAELREAKPYMIERIG